jgi:hypothetical protein
MATIKRIMVLAKVVKTFGNLSTSAIWHSLHMLAKLITVVIRYAAEN